MSYPKVSKSVSGQTNIILQKNKFSVLSFYAQGENCQPLNLIDYKVDFKIYAKNSEYMLGLGQSITTVTNPTSGKVTFTMTTNDTVDNYCGLEEGCCYKYEVIATKKVSPFGDCVTIACGSLCIEKCNLSK